MTARVHTGDPSVFGAHREQMDALKQLGIPYEVIPGVSSFVAAAGCIEKGIYTSGSQPDCYPDEDGRPDGRCLPKRAFGILPGIMRRWSSF